MVLRSQVTIFSLSKTISLLAVESGIKTSEEILEEITSFQKSRILLTALELKVFTNLSGKLLTAEQLAEKINAEPKPLERLLNALVALGYLRKAKGKFYNEKISDEYLTEGKPNFIGSVYHQSYLWETWSVLTKKIKQNFTPPDPTEAFIEAMHYRALKTAKLVPYLIDLSNARTVLDVGGGSGVFAYGLLDAKPDLEIDLLDLPKVIKIAKRFAQAEGKIGKVNFVEGDYKLTPFKKKYDLILLFSIIHSNSTKENKALVKKCAEALNPNGQLVIRDYVMSEEFSEPKAGALFSINMLVNTKAGNVFTKGEILSWLDSAGLGNVEFKEAGKSSTLVVAQKI